MWQNDVVLLADVACLIIEDPEDGGDEWKEEARPRLSSAAASASLWAAKAGSAVLRAEKKAPAMAEEVSRPGVLIDEMVRPFGRFWMERREMGLVGLVRLLLVFLCGLMHLALRIATVAMVAAIETDE